ncbi:GNAT family N-acetyltransferase [Rhodosalinus sediminis]|uniref:GNAT family N-acetyltransferase n=1 Tax=Rhodosalinus sediminis TaxID=1940533 RepID=UPI002356B515|nr:GNAT family N-acetyltransferase [Rhodosalinus sediminis]
MVEIVTESMAALARWHGAILRFGPQWTPAQARPLYEGHLRLGTRASVAFEGDHVVGTSLYFPAQVDPWIVERADQSPEPLAGCILRTHIYVAEAAQGQGLSRQLTTATVTDALAQGYSHVLALGYQTEEIFTWARQIHAGLPSRRDLPFVDRNGRPTWITALVDLLAGET